MLVMYAERYGSWKIAETNCVVNVPSAVRKAPMRSAAPGTTRNAIAQKRNGATPSQPRPGRRRPARGAAGRTTSIDSALVASGSPWDRYPATSFHPSLITCVALSVCSGVGNCTSE
jgi:hypothetical protein